MATVSISDWEYKKPIDGDSNGTSPGSEKVRAFILDGSLSEGNTGNNAIGYDTSRIDTSTTATKRESIVITDSDESTTLNYEIENPADLGTTTQVVVMVYKGSWPQDGSTDVVFGIGGGDGTDYSVDGTGGNPYAQTNVNAELIMHLDGDATDSSPDNNDGTLTGTTNTSGQLDGALDFDGTDDKIDLPATSNSFDFGTSSFSFSSWFKTSTSSTDTIIKADEQGGGNVAWLARLQDVDSDSDFELRSQARDSNGNIPTVDSTVRVDDGNWHHLFVVVEPSNDNFFLYIDGNQEASDTSAGWTGNFNLGGGSEVFSVGYNPSGNDQHFPGIIDEVKVFSKGPSSSFVSADYEESPKAGFLAFDVQSGQTTTSAVTATVNDSLQFNETTSTTLQFTASDSVGFTENDQTTLKDTLNDSLQFTEATKTQLIDTLTDQLNFTENQAGKLIDTLTDSLAFTENTDITLALTVTATDSLTFGENIDSRLIDTLKDQLGFTEATQGTLINTFADQLGFTENVETAIAEVLTDQLNFSEATSIKLADTLTDSLDFSENIQSQLIDTLTDDLGFTEATAGGIAVSLSDQLDFSENFETLLKDSFEDKLEFDERAFSTVSAVLTDQLSFSDQVVFASLLTINAPSKALITTKDKFAVMQNHTFKEGDLADELSATLEDEDGAIDLSQANNVRLQMHDRSGSNVLNKKISIDDAANGKVTYSWSSGDPIDTAGVYRAEFVIEDNNSEDETVPNDGYVTVEVEENLD